MPDLTRRLFLKGAAGLAAVAPVVAVLGGKAAPAVKWAAETFTAPKIGRYNLARIITLAIRRSAPKAAENVMANNALLARLKERNVYNV